MAATNPSRSPLVSVCLLNYNGGPFVRGCFEGLRGTRYTPWELIVVDNASRDGSAELVAAELERFPPSVPTRLLRLDRNLGYAGGHNAGAGLAQGEFVAFLNMTSQVEPDWLEIVPWIERQPDVGFAQPLIADDPDRDRIQSLGSRMSLPGRLHIIGRKWSYDPRPNVGPFGHEVFSVLGAAFVGRRSVFGSLGGFDSSFFMYFEESDLCWRAWLQGWRSMCWVDPRCQGRVFHRFRGTGPASLDVERLFDRNQIVSMFQNLERRHLPYVVWNGLVVSSELVRHPRTLLRLYSELLQRLPQAARRRRQVQRERRVGDARMFGLTEPGYLAEIGHPPA
jgi:GT2 family glycosyltransferase